MCGGLGLGYIMTEIMSSPFSWQKGSPHPERIWTGEKFGGGVFLPAERLSPVSRVRGKGYNHCTPVILYIYTELSKYSPLFSLY